MSYQGWIGVDLDSTLAHYDGWKGFDHIGEPIPAMAEQMRRWLAEGLEVRIFTARAYEWETCAAGEQRALLYKRQVQPIVDWGQKHFAHIFRVTCMKDMAMVQLYDDRCIQVEPNTGKFIGGTNVFPDGKIGDNDEGELKIAIGVRDGVVGLHFGKSIAWLGMSPEQAISLGSGLIKCAQTSPGEKS